MKEHVVEWRPGWDDSWMVTKDASFMFLTCCALDYALDNDLDNYSDYYPDSDLDSDLNHTIIHDLNNDPFS